jgi:hypothetical protein
MMSWFKQTWGSDPIAGAYGQDAAGINDATDSTSAAILSAPGMRWPPGLGVAGSASTDETKRRQLALLESYVARIRLG